MIQIEQRASTVLYKFLISNCDNYHFLIPANVCSVVPLTFLASGVDFSFVDINESTHAGSFDGYKKAIEDHIGRKIDVLFVNAYGYGMIRDGFAYHRIEAPFNENGYSEQLKKIRACRKSGELFQYEENYWLSL